jgi:hypothetical protein
MDRQQGQGEGVTMAKIEFVDADPLLDRNDLKRLYPAVPNSKNQLRRLVARGFPAAIRLSRTRSVWRKSKVDAYVRQQEAASEEQAQKIRNQAAKAKGRV